MSFYLSLLDLNLVVSSMISSITVFSMLVLQLTRSNIITEHLEVLLEDRKNSKMLASEFKVELAKEITETEVFINVGEICCVNEI